jgi:PilZ domain
LIHSDRHRAPRHSFVAGIDLTDLQSENHLAAHIKDLNLLGCFVETVTPFPDGTKVRLIISHAGKHFSAIGKVAYSRPNSGMGIAFVTIEPSSLEVLDLWLANLRK